MLIKTSLQIKLVTFLISLTLFSACSIKRNNLFVSPTDQLADTLKTVLVINDKGPSETLYKIKPNDLIAIRNLQNLEFGNQQGEAISERGVHFYVDTDGTVNLPAIGKVAIGGLTRREAGLKIQEVYGNQVLKNPIIELSVINLKVTVLGAFKIQGNFLLEKDNTNLIEILGQAGGLLENGESGKIKIVRGDRTKPEIIYVNLKDINSLSSSKLVLQNNDIIYAETSKTNSFREFLTVAQPIIGVLSTVISIYAILK